MNKMNLKSFLYGFIGHDPTYQSIMQTINFSFALLVVFFLPFHLRPLLIVVFFWILSWLLEFNFKAKFILNTKGKISYKLLLGLVVFYFLHIAGSFYSSNINSALFDLEVKLSLILFPLVFITSNWLYKQHRKMLLYSFLFGLFVSSLFCLGVAFLSSIGLIDGEIIFNTAISQRYADESFFLLVGNRLSLFSYTRLSVFLHPTYYSMYLIFGVIVSYYFYRISEKKRLKSIFIFMMIFFYVMVYLLSTRAGLISLSATLISLTIVESVRKKNYALIFFISFALIYALYAAMTLTPLNKNIKEVKQWVETEQNKQSITKENRKIEFKASRFLIWQSSLNTIQDNFLFGTGTGSVKDQLKVRFRQVGFQEGVEKNYDAHNQYLNTFISHGIIGFILLILMLASIFFYSLKNNRILLSYLLSLVAFNFLFESIMSKAAGILFFAFFVSYLVIYSPTPIKEQK